MASERKVIIGSAPVRVQFFTFVFQLCLTGDEGLSNGRSSAHLLFLQVWKDTDLGETWLVLHGV